MIVSHFSVFLKIQICPVFGPDKLTVRGWIGSLARRVDCFDEIPALTAIYALLYNVTCLDIDGSSIDVQTQR